MKFSRARTRFAVLLMAATGGLVLAGSAFAHAQVMAQRMGEGDRGQHHAAAGRLEVGCLDRKSVV